MYKYDDSLAEDARTAGIESIMHADRTFLQNTGFRKIAWASGSLTSKRLMKTREPRSALSHLRSREKK